MKLSHLLPITALVAGCSTPVPPSAPVSQSRLPTPSVARAGANCVKGVENILEHPYGDGLTLEMRRPDSCADPMGDFNYRQKIERRGRFVFTPTAKLPAGIRQRTLDILITRGENGEQVVLVGGKPLTGKQKDTLLLRVEDLEKNGPIEREK